MPSAKNATIRFLSAAVLLLGLCGGALSAAESTYGKFSLSVDVVNRVLLQTGSGEKNILFTLTGSHVPDNSVLKLETTRLFPDLSPEHPIQKMNVGTNVVRYEESLARQSLPLAGEAETQPAIGYYQLRVRLAPGQRPSLRETLGDATDHLACEELVFVGSRTRAFETVLEEAKASIMAQNALLEAYNPALGRRYAQNEDGTLVQVEIPVQDQGDAYRHMRDIAMSALRSSTSATMPSAFAVFHELDMFAKVLFNPAGPPTLEPLERSIAVSEMMTLRTALLNLHYFAVDTAATLDALTEQALREGRSDAIAAAALECSTLGAAAQSTWTGLKADFFNDAFLLRNDAFSRMGPIPASFQQFEADCDRFRTAVRDEDFKATLDSFLEDLASLSAEYAAVLDSGGEVEHRGKAKTLRARFEEKGKSIAELLRTRGDILRALEMEVEKEAEKD